MRIHFFPHYADDVSDTPFAAELARMRVPHRFFKARIDLKYRSTAELLLRVYPRLFRLALRNAIASLLRSEPRPTHAVVNTEVEALVFGLVKVFARVQTKIIFETFIYTSRGEGLLGRLHRAYLRLILSRVDAALCHARHETREYKQSFASTGCQFLFVPYGTTVHGREAMINEAAVRPPSDPPLLVTAGRSARDYTTLLAAIRGLPCRLLIISDSFDISIEPRQSAQVTVLRNCFGMEYLQQLARAELVVVPLARDSISAGQMVLLQARALRKPLIITRTATTVEYATDGEDALMVERSDVAGLHAAIERLLQDAALRETLAARGGARFERDHSTEAYVRALVATIAAASADGLPVPA